MTAIFLQGNSRDVLRTLPADYFHCAVTSPPYYGLRRYDGGIEDWGAWRGQLGGESSPDCGGRLLELKSTLTSSEREYVLRELKKAGVI